MSKKILIVEDDDVVVNILEKIISSIGYESVHSSSVKDALMEVKESQPDLILLDLNLEDERGHRLLEKKATNKWLVDIPVIILTASMSRSDVIIGKTRGVVDYIVKPFNGKQLIERIEKALNQSAP